MWVLFHIDCHTKRLWNTTCSPPAHQVHSRFVFFFLLVDERLTGRAHSSSVSKSPPLPAMMLWLCGVRLQTVNKRWMPFPAVQNEASALFWMSSRWRLLWPSSLIIWSWWVHGLSRCFQVSLNATVLILLFPLEFVKKEKEGDAHWLTTCDWKSFTNEHTVPFSDFTNRWRRYVHLFYTVCFHCSWEASPVSRCSPPAAWRQWNNVG